MATMDITPQELRDIEIREAWRGYHRDDVDELLERAAATIEHLEAETAQLRSRGAQGPQVAAPPPAAPQPASVAPQPVPVAPRPAVPEPATRTGDTDVIQRTLVLAQKAADEAVAEAKARAGQIVTESEEQAQRLVDEAEANARRIADAEKAKLEEEIVSLMAARDTLTADVDALERFEQEYRERLRNAIEAELELLSQTVSATQRPAVHEVDLPTGGPSWSASQEGEGVTPPAAPAPAPPEPAPAPATSGSSTSGPSTVHIEAVPAHQAAEGEQAWDPAPAGGWDASQAPVAEDAAEHESASDDHAHGESLDDDAFFASLREAVRDDAPLGPGNEDDTAFFDQDDTDEHRRLFKRRR